MADDRTQKRVFCRRNHVSKSADEHLGCPYCYGRLREVVEQGEPQRFCDWDPDNDPVTFGFPDDSSRNQRS